LFLHAQRQQQVSRKSVQMFTFTFRHILDSMQCRAKRRLAKVSYIPELAIFEADSNDCWLVHAFEQDLKWEYNFTCHFL
jgi:hypothetical protein